MTSMSERLKAIRAALGESQKGMARRFSLGENGWQHLELGDRAPKGEVLARLVEMGFSADWLLTGAGAMRRDAPPEPPPALDEELLREALQIVEDWLAANRRVMPATKKAEVVAGIYAMAADDAAEGKPLEPKRVAQILKLVG